MESRGLLPLFVFLPTPYSRPPTVSLIHSTALIHPDAVIADGVTIGPWCVVEAGVRLGAGTTLGPFCRVLAGSTLGAGVTLDGGAVVGGLPQDLKHGGEPSRTEVGAGARVGEYATVNRSSTPGGVTRVGERCLVMAYAHIAHDCVLGDGAIVANAVQLGGHVRVGAGAVISGMTGVHQFTVIGAGAFIGGGLRVDVDVPPFCKALGEPLRWGGLNLTGLRRGGADSATASFLDSFYRALHAKGAEHARTALRETPGFESEKTALEDFFAHRRRGLLKRGNG
jgi:UDP-N-acetylglucosamine acyltransferase